MLGLVHAWQVGTPASYLPRHGYLDLEVRQGVIWGSTLLEGFSQ